MTKKQDFMKEINGLSVAELRTRAKSLSEQIMKDRVGKVTDPSKDPVSRRQAERELAQVLTVINAQKKAAKSA